MNFFKEQRQAHKNTIIMVFLFVLALGLSVFLVNLAVWGVLSLFHFSWLTANVTQNKIFWALNGLIFSCSCVMLAFHLYDLRDPLKVFLSYTFAEMVPRDDNFYHKRLHNIVDEMSIASSLARPKVFVVRRNWSINAFAVGHEINKSAVFVTEGALTYLNRDELQAVIAHEFSHILNGDMKSNVMMMASIQALEGVYRFAWDWIYGHEDRQSTTRWLPSNNFLVFALSFAVMVAGSIGMFFSKVLKASISRQREYLADASAVQFTRQTEGMIGVLKKIAFLEAQGVKKDFHMPSFASHMMFSNVLSGEWFETHPPIVKRIQRMDPRFKDGALFSYVKKQQQNLEESAGYFNGQREDASLGFSKVANDVSSSAKNNVVSSLSIAPAPQITSKEMVFMLGHPSAHSVDIGHAIHQHIPADLNVSSDVSLSQSVLLACLLSRNVSIRQRQCQFLSSSQQDAEDALRRHQKISELPSFVVMAVVLLHVSSLSEMPIERLKDFVFLFRHLTHQKNEMTALEFSVFLTIWSHVEELTVLHKKKHGHWRLQDVRKEVQQLLWLLSGHNKDGRVFSYHLGWKAVDGTVQKSTPSQETSWTECVAALQKLNGLSWPDKSKLMEGISSVVAYDGRWTGDEFALVRAICFALHCPLPLAQVDI